MGPEISAAVIAKKKQDQRRGQGEGCKRGKSPQPACAHQPQGKTNLT